MLPKTLIQTLFFVFFSAIQLTLSCMSFLQSLWMSVQTVSSSSQASQSVCVARKTGTLLDGRWRGYPWYGRRRARLMKASGDSMVQPASSLISLSHQVKVFTGVNTTADRGAQRSPSLYQVEERLYVGLACLVLIVVEVSQKAGDSLLYFLTERPKKSTDFKYCKHFYLINVASHVKS